MIADARTRAGTDESLPAERKRGAGFVVARDSLPRHAGAAVAIDAFRRGLANPDGTFQGCVGPTHAQTEPVHLHQLLSMPKT
jgi:hypothetical protein